MVYRSLGVLISHSSITIAFIELHENAGKWTYDLKVNSIYPVGTTDLPIDDFISKNELQYKVALITIHTEVEGVYPNGASIAAATALPVITDLPALDKQLGGNGEFLKTTAEKLGITEELNDVLKAICIALMGVLRWREEYNFLSSATGASRSSIGGAIWLGQEA